MNAIYLILVLIFICSFFFFFIRIFLKSQSNNRKKNIKLSIVSIILSLVFIVIGSHSYYYSLPEEQRVRIEQERQAKKEAEEKKKELERIEQAKIKEEKIKKEEEEKKAREWEERRRAAEIESLKKHEESRKEKYLSYSFEQIASNFNEKSAGTNFGAIDESVCKRKKNKEVDSINCSVNNVFSISFIYSPDTNNMKFIAAMFNSDGSKESVDTTLFSILNFINALTPNMTPKERNKIVKALGIADGSMTDGKERAAMFNDTRVTTFFGPLGLIISAKPAM